MIRSVNYNHTHIGKIGDSVIIEPALSAYAQRHNVNINLYVAPEHVCLYMGHPYITAFSEPLPTSDLTLDVGDAFQWSHANHLPFGAGFFHQLGMEITPGTRLHYNRFVGLLRNRSRSARNHDIVIIPFGYSCTGRAKQRPNVEAPLSWWRTLTDTLHSTLCGQCYIRAFAAGNIEWEADLDFIHINKGWDLSDVMDIMKNADLLISVETGILHLASATKTPTVFLSCATPEYFAKPDTRCRVVRAAYADEFRQDEVIAASLDLIGMHT